MSQTDAFIQRLESLQQGEQSRLRRLAGQPLNATLSGFDLFTGLWWPLRAGNRAAPRRETSWMIAKLFGEYDIPHVRPSAAESAAFACVLGRCEPRDERGRPRFRARFDELLSSPLPQLEPHLRWGLSEVAKAAAGRVPWAMNVSGVDWAQLLDDLCIWDRGEEHRRERDIRDIWAEAYLNATK